jgi:hypothetical protein
MQTTEQAEAAFFTRLDTNQNDRPPGPRQRKGIPSSLSAGFPFPLSNSPALSFGCQLQRVRRRLSHWEGKSGVFQRYSQVKLQTKREALAQLNRRGIEITPGVAHLTDVRMGFGTALVRC